MARKLRLEYPGACYHVTNRGNYRQGIFGPKGAAEAFERVVAETCERFGWRVHAYVIMRNHFHVAVETPQPNLSVGMKYLQGTWANRFNRFRGLVGRPFQGRYKAKHVEPGHALAQVALYIHLNPLEAKVVESDGVGRFRWSSLWWYGRRDRPVWLMGETVLAEAGGLPDTPAGWTRYRAYVAALAEQSPHQRMQAFAELNRGWAIGSADFRRALIADLRARGASLEKATRAGENKGERLLLRAELWDERLLVAARALRIDFARLGPRKSDPDKVRLAAVMKAATDVSNAWLAARLGMGTPASVSQFVRRFHLAGGARDIAYNKALSRVKT
jgi:REP element-mobilizing transposase RayT